MSVREEVITLDPMDIVWGSREKSTIQTVADVAGDLSGTHFLLASARDVIKYYVLLDNGSALDPAPAGRTKITVLYADNDDADTIAGFLNTALDALIDFNSSVSTDTVTLENSEPGKSEAVTEVDSTFTFTQILASKGRDLGGTQGGIEISPETNLVDVQADQTGEQTLDQIINASNLTFSMTLLELTKENFELLLGEVAGELFTVNSKTVVGFGESKRFKNMSQFALEMRMKPVGATDNDQNWHFWKVYPVLDSIAYSGSDLSNMSVTWRALRDITKDTKINMFIRGDGTKISSV